MVEQPQEINPNRALIPCRGKSTHLTCVSQHIDLNISSDTETVFDLFERLRKSLGKRLWSWGSSLGSRFSSTPNKLYVQENMLFLFEALGFLAK